MKVPVWVEQIGTAEPGQWCDECCFPSAHRVKLVWGSEMTVIGETTLVGCGDCGSVTYE